MAVVGVNGQVAQSLAEIAPGMGVEVLRIGRPDLDLANPVGARPKLRALSPDVVVNAAAYTAVDRAESEPELAQAINGIAPGVLAAVAAELGAPFIHLSTDYVFQGSGEKPYTEDAPLAPTSAYGLSKAMGEREVARFTVNSVVLRLAWVYSPFGHNFVKTMLRLAQTREEIPVVADQVGSPTSALDAAAGIIAVARNLVTRPSDVSLRGTFHMAGTGYASWADFAAEVFAASAAAGGPQARVKRITTAEYPTPARRPANSRLDCSRLTRIHGVTLPTWRDSVGACVRRLVGTTQAVQP